MLTYIKKNFSTPENGLVQVIITHVLVFIGLLFLKTIHKLTGLINFEQIYHNICLSSDAIYTKPWTIITYFFVDQHIGSFLFNLLYLYTFGRIVVYFLGSKKFLMLYLLGGVIGGVTFIFSYNFLPYFIKIKEQALQNSTTISLVGSSAALYAIITGITTFAPNFSLSFFPFFSLKIKYIAFVFLLWPVLHLSYSKGGEGVNMARIGGILWGYLYIKYLLFYNNKRWRVWLNKIYLPFKKVQHFFTKNSKKLTDTDTPPITKKDDSNIPKEEVEAILDKIALYGYKNLTKEEKKRLFDSGED